jgi:hypothetical protein
MKKLSKELSLAYLYPELSKEWDYEKNYPLRPEDVFAHSGQKAGWICIKGHRYDSVIAGRSGCGHGCPYCYGLKICKDNCLATLRPDLAKEWDYEKNYPLTPEDVSANSHKKFG